MTMTERATVVGVFSNRAQAESAINDLHSLGFTDREIGYIVRDAGSGSETGAPVGAHAENAVAGAVGGGVLGGILGAAASLLIPGFGPAIAGGILAATLGGAAIGAAAGGLIGVLNNLGVPEEDARYYQGEFEAGRILVTIQAAGRQQEVLEVLRRNGAYDASMRGNGVASGATYNASGSAYDRTNIAGTGYNTNTSGVVYNDPGVSTRETRIDDSPVGRPYDPTDPRY